MQKTDKMDFATVFALATFSVGAIVDIQWGFAPVVGREDAPLPPTNHGRFNPDAHEELPTLHQRPDLTRHFDWQSRSMFSAVNAVKI
jgi:hypothetical protein